MSSLDAVLSMCASLVAIFCLKRWASYRSQQLPLPPGPPRLPILGNLFNWPWEKSWETWAKWGQQYGDIVYVTIGTSSLIVVNSVEAAIELFNNKATIYSDRPEAYFTKECIGWGNVFITLPDGPRLRAIRRLLLQEVATKNALSRFEPMVQERTRHFVHKILKQHSPEGLMYCVRILFSSIILDATYGYQVKDEGDELIPIIEQVIDDGTDYARPGSILVDIFPYVKWLPSWMPGTGYRELGRKLRQEFESARDIPYTFTKNQMAAGTHRPSIVARQLEGQQLSTDDEDALRHTALLMYGAGAETTISAGSSLLLLMALHPEIQARAQAEIDSVVGSTRLPNLSDREHLPYLKAIISEVLRFTENIPTGVPHMLHKDDIHNGFLMPKGAFVFTNIWAMSRDPKVYTNPDKFDPERFMGSKPELDPRTYVFGLGRRICPGRFFAENNLFLVFSTIIATLSIEKAHDTDGNEANPTIEFKGTNARHPKPFPCKIRVRSAQAEALLDAESA